MARKSNTIWVLLGVAIGAGYWVYEYYNKNGHFPWDKVAAPLGVAAPSGSAIPPVAGQQLGAPQNPIAIANQSAADARTNATYAQANADLLIVKAANNPTDPAAAAAASAAIQQASQAYTAAEKAAMAAEALKPQPTNQQILMANVQRKAQLEALASSAINRGVYPGSNVSLRPAGASVTGLHSRPGHLGNLCR